MWRNYLEENMCWRVSFLRIIWRNNFEELFWGIIWRNMCWRVLFGGIILRRICVGKKMIWSVSEAWDKSGVTLEEFASSTRCRSVADIFRPLNVFHPKCQPHFLIDDLCIVVLLMMRTWWSQRIFCIMPGKEVLSFWVLKIYLVCKTALGEIEQIFPNRLE